MNKGPYLCMAEKSINSVRTGKKEADRFSSKI